MNYDVIPVIRKENFIRYEKDKALIVPEKGVNFMLTVNKAGARILKLCNTKNSINNIVETLKIKFSDTATEKILEDVLKFINDMRRLNIIYCKLEDEMYTGKDIYESEKYIIHRCGEGDIEKLCKLINSDAISTYIENKVNTKSQSQRLILRNNLFNYLEEFYILKNKENDCLALVGLRNTLNNYINIYDISICNIYKNLSDKDISNFIINCINDLKKSICKNCTKIKVALNSNNEEIGKFSNILLSLKFDKIGTFKDEFGIGFNKIEFEKMI